MLGTESWSSVIGVGAVNGCVTSLAAASISKAIKALVVWGLGT